MSGCICLSVYLKVDLDKPMKKGETTQSAWVTAVLTGGYGMSAGETSVRGTQLTQLRNVKVMTKMFMRMFSTSMLQVKGHGEPLKTRQGEAG